MTVIFLYSHPHHDFSIGIFCQLYLFLNHFFLIFISHLKALHWLSELPVAVRKMRAKIKSSHSCRSLSHRPFLPWSCLVTLPPPISLPSYPFALVSHQASFLGSLLILLFTLTVLIAPKVTHSAMHFVLLGIRGSNSTPKRTSEPFFLLTVLPLLHPASPWCCGRRMAFGLQP